MSNLIVSGNGSLTDRESNTSNFPRLSTWIDEMFNRELPSVFTSNYTRGMSLPQVNIQETPDSYLVEMAVPGLKKSDFDISLDNNDLIISAETKTENEEENKHFTRREFGYSSFKRSFMLPETVDESKIKAKYEDGILNIELPKKEEAKQRPPKQIKIS